MLNDNRILYFCPHIFNNLEVKFCHFSSQWIGEERLKKEELFSFLCLEACFIYVMSLQIQFCEPLFRPIWFSQKIYPCLVGAARHKTLVIFVMLWSRRRPALCRRWSRYFWMKSDMENTDFALNYRTSLTTHLFDLFFQFLCKILFLFVTIYLHTYSYSNQSTW